MLEEKQKVLCENCHKRCNAQKEFFIRNPPPILVVQLKRFKSSGYSLSKNSKTIRTLEQIYLDDYVIFDGILLNLLNFLEGPKVILNQNIAKNVFKLP